MRLSNAVSQDRPPGRRARASSSAGILVSDDHHGDVDAGLHGPDQAASGTSVSGHWSACWWSCSSSPGCCSRSCPVIRCCSSRACSPQAPPHRARPSTPTSSSGSFWSSFPIAAVARRPGRVLDRPGHRHLDVQAERAVPQAAVSGRGARVLRAARPVRDRARPVRADRADSGADHRRRRADALLGVHVLQRRRRRRVGRRAGPSRVLAGQLRDRAEAARADPRPDRARLRRTDVHRVVQAAPRGQEVAAVEESAAPPSAAKGRANPTASARAGTGRSTAARPPSIRRAVRSRAARHAD